MEETLRITCVLEDLSSLKVKDESCCSTSIPFAVSGYTWRAGAYIEGKDPCLYVFLQLLETASLPPLWSRDVKFSFSFVDNDILNVEAGEAQCCFTKEANTWGFKYSSVQIGYLGFLINKRFRIKAKVKVLPSSKEEHQASEGESSCQVEQETENASKENLDGDDEDANDDDPSYKDGSWKHVAHAINALRTRIRNKYDYTTEVTNSNDDDTTEEAINALRARIRNKYDYTTEVTNSNDDDTTEESSEDDDDDDDDDDSSLVSKDDARDVTSLNQVKSLEGTSQTVEKGTKTANNLLYDIQPAEEINGFKVSSSQVEWVSRIFERHPDIALGFRPKNQEIRTAYMNQLLSLIETLCKSQEKLSLDDDLSKAEETLCDLTDVGFKLDWLKTKMNEVTEKKKKQEGSGAKVQAMEEELQKLKLMVLDLETQLQNSKAEALAATTPLSFDDVV